MKQYLPIDLPGLFYIKINQRLNKKEYSRLCRELNKKRYSVVKASEALALYDQGLLQLRDQVRVIWIHDIESPSDNWLAEEIAAIEAQYGLSSTHNIRIFCMMNEELLKPLYAVIRYGGEIGYQYEELVATRGNVQEAQILFGKNLAAVRKVFPGVTTAFSHGVWLSGIDSTNQFKTNGQWNPEVWRKFGIHKNGELYYFMDILKQNFPNDFHYLGEDRYLGADEFLAALRNVAPGGIVMFLQHPTYWSTITDINSWKRLRTDLQCNQGLVGSKV